MSNKWPKLLVLALFGVVLIIIGTLMNGGVSDLKNEFVLAEVGDGLESFEDADLSNIKNVEINIKNSSVTINSNNVAVYETSSSGICDKLVRNGDTIVLGYCDETKYTLSSPVKDITLTSEQISGGGAVVLKIPDGTELENVTINAKNSDIKIDTINATNVTIHNTRGEVEIESLTAAKLDINNGNGDVEVGKINCETSCSVVTKNGDVELGEENDEINVLYGLTVETVKGDIDVLGQTLGTANITTKKGEINLTLNGTQSSYTLYPNCEINYGSTSGTSSGTGNNGVVNIIGKKGKVNVSFK